MFQAAMSNSTLSEEASLSSFNPLILQNTNIITPSQQPPPPSPPKKVKKKRSLPGNPDPDAEVIALSPKTLLATNRFICEICNKGFQRDQNLQLHRRGHNLPWKLKQRSNKDVVRKKAYVCPEPTCVHHHPSRALGDLTGIKKHFCRKHGEKKYKCEKCSKIYAVQSDWKAHSKTCGTREYRCDCGTLFSRKDSFITHRAFCDALAEESARLSTNPFTNPILPPPPPHPFSNLSSAASTAAATATASQNPNSHLFPFSSPWDQAPQNPNTNPNPLIQIKTETNPNHHFSPPFTFQQPPPPFTAAPDSAHFLSATALLQKAATMGAVTTTTTLLSSQQSQQAHHQAALVAAGLDELAGASFRPTAAEMGLGAQLSSSLASLAAAATWQQKNNDGFTRDFLGLAAGDHYGGRDHHHHHQRGGGGGRFEREEEDGDDHHHVLVGDMLKFTGGLQYGMTAPYDGDNSSSSSSVLLLKPDHHHHHHDHQVHHHHDHQVHHDDQGFGTFVTSTALESRWG